MHLILCIKKKIYIYLLLLKLIKINSNENLQQSGTSIKEKLPIESVQISLINLIHKPNIS